MIFETGRGYSVFHFSERETRIDTWEDAGGKDLLLAERFWNFDNENQVQLLINTGSDLLFGYPGGPALKMPLTEAGTASIEYLRFTGAATVAPGPALAITTGFSQDLIDFPTQHAGFAFAGTAEADRIVVPNFSTNTFIKSTLVRSEIYAGAGDDVVRLPSEARVLVYGGLGDDRVSGQSTANNIFHGGRGEDTLIGSAGRDFLEGGSEADVLVGGVGNDTLAGEFQYGGTFKAGDDLLRGGAGRDVLHGAGGDDTLKGGSGRDEISGDDGSDRLTGGGGADVFYFSKFEAGIDTVTDFDAAKDSLYFWDEGLRNSARFERVDGDTLVYVNKIQVAVLADASLRAADITFSFFFADTPDF